MYNKDKIKAALNSKGYKWFAGKNYDVNIVGIRNSQTLEHVTNKFDDLMTISYRDECGEWNYFEFECTTDPGKHWVENLMNESGVAIVKEGQYRGSHEIRKHRGQYDALCQKGLLKVYRDKNLDEAYDFNEENVAEGYYGINIHRAGANSTQIDKWSAGCQVFAKRKNFDFFMDIMYNAKAAWGNSFTYTLINSDDLL